TYRFHPHTSDDDDRTYRSREEVEEAKRNDSILVFGEELKHLGLIDDDGIERIRGEIKAEVDAEVDAAWTEEDPPAASLYEHVFADFLPPGPDGRPFGSNGHGNAKDDALETTGGEATPAEAPAEGDRP